MNLLLSLVLLAPAHALVVQTGARPAGTSLVTPAAPAAGLDLTAAKSLLSSPASLVGSLPAAQALRSADPETSRGAAALAPFAAALAAAGNDPMAALLAASRDVSAQAEALTSQTVYPQDGAGALEDLAHRLDEFAATRAAYLSAARQVELKQAASDLRAAAAGNLVASARRTADALGTTPEPGAVAGAETSRPKSLERAVFEEKFPDLAGPVPAPASAAETKKGFNAFNVVVYTGGGLVMTALGWFLFANLAPLGAGGVLSASLMFGSVLFSIASLLRRRGERVASGVLFTAALSMVPVVVTAASALLFDESRVISSIWTFRAAAVATLAAAVLLAQRVKFAFLAMPAALMAWGLSLDLANQLFDHGAMEWTKSMAMTSAFAGGLLMAAARWIETKTKVDYPFWLYLAGLLAFSGGLALYPSSGELGRFLYAMAHLGLVGAGLYLNRRTFAVFGYLGFNAWVLHLAWKFGETFGFAAGLGGAGLVLILSAVALKKYGAAAGAWLRGVLKPA